MTASKLVVPVSDRTIAHLIAGVLSDLFVPAPNAVTVFEANGSDATAGWLVEAYYDGAGTDASRAATFFAETLQIPAPLCRLEVVPDENWVAKSQAALPPVFAGRFVVHGSHDSANIGRGWFKIKIDAGEAFGTAHHATTYGCLLALDRLTRRRQFRNVLDLGTGSGVLALAVQRAMPKAHIIATDLDQRSIEVAQENAAENALTGRCDRHLQFIAAAGFDHPDIRRQAPFDLVVANILAGPLMALALDIAHHVQPGAAVVLSGILVNQADEVMARYRAHGFVLQRHQRDAEWSVLEFIKAS